MFSTLRLQGIVILLALGVAACEEPAGPEPVASVSVFPLNVTLIVGNKQQLSATALDDDGNVLSDRDVAWSSADTTIAKVGATGEMTAVAPGGLIVMTTVYDPSDGTGAVPGRELPPWPDGPAVVRALNAALADLAQRHGAVVADVHARFLGHGAEAGDPGQPDPRPANGELWYCGVIEPNAWGAHEIRCAWWEALQRSGPPR